MKMLSQLALALLPAFFARQASADEWPKYPRLLCPQWMKGGAHWNGYFVQHQMAFEPTPETDLPAPDDGLPKSKVEVIFDQSINALFNPRQVGSDVTDRLIRVGIPTPDGEVFWDNIYLFCKDHNLDLGQKWQCARPDQLFAGFQIHAGNFCGDFPADGEEQFEDLFMVFGNYASEYQIGARDCETEQLGNHTRLHCYFHAGPCSFPDNEGGTKEMCRQPPTFHGLVAP